MARGGIEPPTQEFFIFRAAPAHAMELPGDGSTPVCQFGMGRCRYSMTPDPLTHRAAVLSGHTVFPQQIS